MEMERLAPDVLRIPLLPGDGLNAYLLGGVLVDAGLPRNAAMIVKVLHGRPITEHVATHAHIDHIGGSPGVVATLGLDGLAIGAGDAEAVRMGRAAVKPGSFGRVLARLGGRFAPAQVTRELREGDEVGPGFQVLDAPGHSPGQIVLWRASDRLLIAGDVLTNVRGLHEPPGILSVDPERNRESVRKLAALEPATVAFGHGKVLRDGTRLRAYVQRRR
ncbi:MAG TPA: MBL fold metallo-hydrolase [Solirubrobacteraceae bacterium]|nr:MBL fold metallo-hydrolase [Solirubrobacteraceae bacterium]